MPRINLLPWRAALRRRRAHRFIITAAATVTVAALILLLGTVIINSLISQQTQHNRRIQHHSDQLQSALRRQAESAQRESALLSRLALIDRLQARRGLAPQLFDSLARTTPPTIQLTHVTQQGGELRIQGLADSNQAVSDYMRRLDASGRFTTARLLTVNALPDPHRRRHPFTLSIGQIFDGLEGRQGAANFP